MGLKLNRRRIRHGLICASILATIIHGAREAIALGASAIGPNPDGKIQELYPGMGRIWIATNDGYFGEEVWVFDPALGETKLLVDIVPGASPSDPRNFLVWREHVYFTARAAALGFELFRSDGTRDGTTLVKDISNDTAALHRPRHLSPLDDELVFVADDGVHGYELWRTNGEEEGTRLMHDVNPANVDITATFPVLKIGEWLLFRASMDGGTGELWRCAPDGSDASRISPEGSHVGAFGGGLFPVPNGAVFRAQTPGEGMELWRTDGTAEGTGLLRDIYEGPNNSDPADMTVFNDVVVFRARDREHGVELWRTDGTAEGTLLVSDISPGGESGDPSPFHVSGDRVFFPADSRAHGRELWMSDGTAEGTVMVADLLPGRQSGNPYAIAPCANGVFFSATDGIHGEELWRTDGTIEGTAMVRDIRPGAESSEPYRTCVLGEVAYFEANDGRHGSELWRSDGTEAGTYLVADIGLPLRDAPSSNPEDLVASPDGALYFSVAREKGGRTFWVRDDARTPPRLLDQTFTVLPPASVESVKATRRGLYALIGRPDGQRRLYFFSKDSAPARRILSDDDTSAPTGKSELWLAADGLYVAWATKSQGIELWHITDDEHAPRIVADIAPGPADSLPRDVVTWGDQLVWVALRDDVGEELWIRDREGAVRLVSDINPGPASAQPRSIAVFDDRLYFVANDGVHGPELWMTGGTPETTGIVADINPVQSALAPGPMSLTIAGDTLYFSAYDGIHGRELWRLDPIEGKISMVADLFVGAPSSNPEEMVNAGGRLYFRAESFLKGVEIFTSDGSERGTHMVSDVALGPDSAWPTSFSVFDEHVFFASRGGAPGNVRSGQEVFWTDGARVEPVELGGTRAGSWPRHFVVAGDALYVSADDGQLGRELWSVTPVGDGTYRETLVWDFRTIAGVEIRKIER